MRSVTAAEASVDFRRLVEAAENGEAVEVTDDGVPVGRLQAGHLAVGERLAQVLSEFTLTPAAAEELAHAVEDVRTNDDITVPEWPVD